MAPTRSANDPNFVDKLRDVVGLYVDPPAHAIVLSLDEKEPNPGSRSHTAGPAAEEGPARHRDARLQAPWHRDPVRCVTSSTATSSAATCSATAIRRSCASGTRSRPRCRPARWSDNYAAHKHPKVRAWLDRHERCLPLHANLMLLLNAVEGFFAKLPRRRLKRGVFRSAVDLQAAINRPTKSSPASDEAPSVSFHPLRAEPPQIHFIRFVDRPAM